MTEREQSIKRLVRRRERQAETAAEKDSPFEKLFESEWEEFVVKFDKRKGEFVTRTVCCSMAPVK